MLYLDASAIRDFLSCREYYRFKYVANKVPAKPSIHREYGIGIHKGVEAFWQGKGYTEALTIAMGYLQSVKLPGITPVESGKWEEMLGYAPDMLGAYYTGMEQDTASVEMVEQEWNYPLVPLVEGEVITLCGRIDLVLSGCLRDLKTATEIGKTWKRDYRELMLRDIGLGLYDWYLVRAGHAPVNVVLDVLLKPSSGRFGAAKPARLERIELPELVTDGYRKRFDMQLRWIAREIAEYHDRYREMRPWPMDTQHSCNTKYSSCEYLPVCNYGRKEEDKLVTRIEHLEVRKNG